MTSPGTSWSQARAIAGDADPLPPFSAALGQALGAVLAHDLTALADQPAADTAAMDGFAICGPGPWRVVDALRAGQVRSSAIRPGEAIEIATGAAVPPGTRAVLRYEDTGRSLCGEITGRVEWGRHIRRAGSDFSAHDVLVPSGTRLTALMLGLAASAGCDEVRVRPRPRVAVTITGAEVRTAGRPSAGATRDALGPAITGLAGAFGGEVVRVQYVGDDELALAGALADDDVHVHVVTGGSCLGPADLLHKVLAAAGAELLVDGVRCRPGHPQLLAAIPGGRRVVGLPGNPFAAVAAVVTLLAPLLTALSGASEAPDVMVRCPEGVPRHTGQTVLVPVRQDDTGGVQLLPRSSSASLRVVAHASHLLAVGGGDNAVLVPVPMGFIS